MHGWPRALWLILKNVSSRCVGPRKFLDPYARSTCEKLIHGFRFARPIRDGILIEQHNPTTRQKRPQVFQSDFGWICTDRSSSVREKSAHPAFPEQKMRPFPLCSRRAVLRAVSRVRIYRHRKCPGLSAILCDISREKSANLLLRLGNFISVFGSKRPKTLPIIEPVNRFCAIANTIGLQ